jgi:hypothetical protein
MTDANTQTMKLFGAQMRYGIAQTVMPAVTASCLELYITGLKIKFVMGNQNVFRLQPIKGQQTFDRLTAAIHKGLRFQQPDVAPADVDFGHFTEKLFLMAKRHAAGGSQLLNKPKPGIVPGFSVFGAGITQPHYQLEINTSLNHIDTTPAESD